MKKVYGLAVAAVFVAAAGLSVQAVEPQGGSGPGAPMRGKEMQQMAAPQASAQQQVTGNVSEITPSKGLLTLASAGGPLKLHFPPPSIGDVKKSDQITVQFAFAKGGAEAQRAYDAPNGLGEHRMTGALTKVDHTTGWIHLQTDQATLQLPFPPQTVHNLKTGDPITIDLAFSKGANP